MQIQHSPTVRRIKGPTILLSSGAYLDFLEPEACDFTIEDIAQGLSNLCRFTGQCRRFYSVAQHSVHIADLLFQGGEGIANAYAGLMHDAPEAFVGDMSKPLKDIVPEYRVVEDRVEAAVFARFRVLRPLPGIVKTMDIGMLATEQRLLMSNRDDWDYTRGHEPLMTELPVWSPERARSEFLDRYELFRGPFAPARSTKLLSPETAPA